MAKFLIEESALDSIKRMAQEVQDQRDELLVALHGMIGLYQGKKPNIWGENTKTMKNARAAIARCQESAKVFE